MLHNATVFVRKITMVFDMIFSSEIAVTLFTLAIILFVVKYLSGPKNLPPGPWGLPFLGYALFLGKKPHETINGLKKKYGDIIKLNLGRESFIFLTSYKAVKEALVKQADIFSSRPLHHYPPEIISPPGIVLSNGVLTTDYRRFVLSKFRDFGFGKSSFELHMKDELSYFLKEIEQRKNQPITNINLIIHKSIFNVLCVFMTGHRYEYTDQKFTSAIELLAAHIKREGISNFEDYIPNFLKTPRIMKFLGIEPIMGTFSQILSTISKIVDEVDKANANDGSLISEWLTETEKDANTTNLTRKQLPLILADLFIAGSDTTTNTLTWGLMYMIAHPEIQAKVQREIDDVIGRERTPSMSDMKLMPYTEATLLEISRIATIVPLGLEHMASSDTTLGGYFIPKNSPIVINLWAVHHDPDVFQQPNEFKPERFLTDTGKVKKVEELIPFSLGKRQCLGESLARMELFIYFTSILQHFSVKKVDGREIDFDYHYAIVSVPKPQPIYVSGR